MIHFEPDFEDSVVYFQLTTDHSKTIVIPIAEYLSIVGSSVTEADKRAKMFATGTIVPTEDAIQRYKDFAAVRNEMYKKTAKADKVRRTKHVSVATA